MEKEIESLKKWLQDEFLKHWKKIIQINRHYNDKELIPSIKRNILFPFIPLEADGYTIRNFIAFFVKYLFQLNNKSFVIIITSPDNSIFWAGFQKIKNNSFADLIELADHFSELSSCIKISDRQKRLDNLKKILQEFSISSEIGFYLLLTTQILSEFKDIYENHLNPLDFYSKIWDLMANHFSDHTLQFFPEPLLFKFLRRLTTKTLILNALEFKKVFGNLLPTQNLLITFLDKDLFSGLGLLTKQDYFQFFIPDFQILQQCITKYQTNQERGLEYLNQTIKTTIPIIGNQKSEKTSTALILTDDFWLKLQDIMAHYSFEFMLDQFFEMAQKIEEKWTIEEKIVLFRRWGKSFMGFQLHRLIPTQPTAITTSILSFLNESLTQILWFVVNDSLELIYIMGTEFEHGRFQQMYLLSDQNIINLFNSEPDKVLAVKKTHSYLAETGNWINQIIVITKQDLNYLISFLPLLTSIKGSLKYLSMIENIITYRMYFYPPNFFADLISRKGATHFFKNIWFPMILQNPD